MTEQADSKSETDALKRLINKSRPTVESRDTSVASVTPDTSIGNLQVERSETDSQKERRATKPELETKQSTLRLEAEVSKRLQVLCQKNGICREVLLEAMFEYCEKNPETLRVVIEAAKQKNDYRQEIANRKRAKSMMDKFG